MNNEPVAWMKLDEVLEHFKSVGCGTVYKTGGEGRVPVYTYPAELTDEEMYQIWLNYGCGMPWTSNTKTFIRAILKRAQEK